MHAITAAQLQNPVDVIAMVNAICDLADEAENKGLNFVETSLRWVAMSLAQELDSDEA